VNASSFSLRLGWSDWVAYYRFAEKIGVKYTQEQSALLAQWDRLVRSSFWVATFESLCIISRAPTKLDVDQRGRLHGAIKFADGWGVHAWHGVVAKEREECARYDDNIANETQWSGHHRDAARMIGNAIRARGKT
jgi:hypothetical protein